MYAFKRGNSTSSSLVSKLRRREGKTFVCDAIFLAQQASLGEKENLWIEHNYANNILIGYRLPVRPFFSSKSTAEPNKLERFIPFCASPTSPHMPFQIVLNIKFNFLSQLSAKNVLLHDKCFWNMKTERKEEKRLSLSCLLLSAHYLKRLGRHSLTVYFLFFLFLLSYIHCNEGILPSAESSDNRKTKNYKTRKRATWSFFRFSSSICLAILLFSRFFVSQFGCGRCCYQSWRYGWLFLWWRNNNRRLNFEHSLAGVTDDSSVLASKLPCFCIGTKALF